MLLKYSEKSNLSFQIKAYFCAFIIILITSMLYKNFLLVIFLAIFLLFYMDIILQLYKKNEKLSNDIINLEEIIMKKKEGIHYDNSDSPGS